MENKKIIKSAVIQMESFDKKSVNCDVAEKLVRKAAKHSVFIVLPEVFNYRGPQHHFSEQAESMQGPTLKRFSKLAKELKINLILGSMLEKNPRAKKSYNTSVHINPEGKVRATYRKMHLFEARLPDRYVSERIALQEGKKAQLTTVERLQVGMSICYDLRFGEQYLKYATSGAKIMLVPSAFTHHTGKDHWEVLLRARAIETQSYVLAANQVGLGGNQIRMYGHSMIIDPWGRILGQAGGDKNEIVYADINIDIINSIRKELPSLTWRHENKEHS